MKKSRRTSPTNKEELDLMVFEAPDRGERVQLEIRSESKTVVDLITSKARQRSVWEAVGSVQRQLRQWLDQTANLKRRRDDWTVLIFVNMTTGEVWNCVV